MTNKRKVIGKTLLWIGILAWLPYGILKYGFGRDVSVLPFLACHLLGIIPGILLTRWDFFRRFSGKPAGARNRR